jgi:hypothetical protein
VLEGSSLVMKIKLYYLNSAVLVGMHEVLFWSEVLLTFSVQFNLNFFFLKCFSIWTIFLGKFIPTIIVFIQLITHLKTYGWNSLRPKPFEPGFLNR